MLATERTKSLPQDSIDRFDQGTLAQEDLNSQKRAEVIIGLKGNEAHQEALHKDSIDKNHLPPTKRTKETPTKTHSRMEICQTVR